MGGTVRTQIENKIRIGKLTSDFNWEKEEFSWKNKAISKKVGVLTNWRSFWWAKLNFLLANLILE